MKASFQIAECSLTSAKVRVFYQITKVLCRFLPPLNLSCKITTGKPRIYENKIVSLHRILLKRLQYEISYRNTEF